VRLSTRSNAVELPAVDATVGTKLVDVLRGEADRDAWRIVEAISIAGRPFELELAWSAGTGAGAQAQITVARSGRVSVFARSVQIRAANLVGSDNRVVVTVADGFAATRNQWEHRSQHVSGVSAIPVPPFAERVRVDLADPALMPLAAVRVRDGLDVVRATYPVDQQPVAGILVGSASAVELDLASATDFRAVFQLAL
jgi:hypothetical protein